MPESKIHPAALPKSSSFLKVMIANILIFFITLSVGAIATEILLRVKNGNQRNYNIEMWRYAKLLKVQSEDPELGHEHQKNKAAKLQGVEIRLNSLGMRGPEPDLNNTSKKRVIVLGSSNTLGWGVAEEDMFSAHLQKNLGDQAQIFNAGIGNYNLHRSVRRFKKRFLDLKPDVVVVQYFINDADILPPPQGNWLLRHSQLAVIVYHVFQTFAKGSKDISGLVDYYQKVYAADSEGLKAMRAALNDLQALSTQQNFKVLFTLIPDIHVLENYPFQFVHDLVRQEAAIRQWEFIDFTEELQKIPAQDLWAMPGDPHLNKTGHKIIANMTAQKLK